MEWVIKKVEHFSDYRKIWDDFNVRYHRSHPLLDSGYIMPLIDVYGDHRVYVAVAYQGEETKYVMLIKSRGWGAWETFSPPQCTMAPVLGSGACIDLEEIKTILKFLPGFAWQMSLLKIDPDFLSVVNQKRSDQVFNYANTMRVLANRDFETYWKDRPRKLKNNVNRYIKRANKEGIEVTIDRLCDLDGVRGGLRVYGEIESTGWKGAAGSAVHIDNEQGRLYKSILENMSNKGWASVYLLRFNSKIVAARLVIKKGNILVFLKTTYDENVARYAPGRLLLYFVLEDIFQKLKDVRYLEFYTSATRDQLQWADESREIIHIQLFKNRAIAILFAVIKRNLRKIRHATDN